LNHFGILHVMRNLLGDWCARRGDAAFAACYALCLVASITLASITFALIEWPFLELRARYLKARPVLQRVGA
jgi:peptidoglycan/LPS O-acetylase OafA/YrhL